jgi:hypothetical protein
MLLALALALTAGCSGADDASDDVTADGAGGFLAFASSFTGFRSWQSWKRPAFGDPSDVHAGLPYIEYLNHAPPHGSTSFPVGTIIVKEPDDDRPATAHVAFAMVKRGAGYNAAGASGWEWFELQEAADGSIGIVWRGLGPPSGESYLGDPTACNDCHAAAKDNDSVLSGAIRLSGF